jgi:hypothetical protein
MLNELVLIEAGARQAAIESVPLHRDVNPSPTRSLPILHVRLNAASEIASIRPLSPDVKAWTLQDGQHNRFPFVQPKPPLWNVSSEHDEKRRVATNVRGSANERRDALLELAESATLNVGSATQSVSEGFLSRLHERRQQLDSLLSSEAAVVPVLLARFLEACNSADGPIRLWRSIEEHLRRELLRTAEASWVNVAAALLVGRIDSKQRIWKCAGVLLFDCDADIPIHDGRLASAVSGALDERENAGSAGSKVGRCALTGGQGLLLSGSFPQCTLPVIGQTYLFSKNTDVPANDRYHRFSSDSMQVGRETVARIGSTLRALTSAERSGKTWRKIPAQASKENDLLLAFVAAAPDAPIASALADEDDLFAEDARTAADTAGESIAEFEKRTQRIIEAVHAKVGADFRHTPVLMAVLRKVDKGNRKVVYSGAPTVGELYDAANEWAQGERNVPPWFALPLFLKGERNPILGRPPHVAPLDVIAFSRQVFIRGGADRQEVAGVPASEAFALFLETRKPGRVGSRFLRLVLSRRTGLLARAACSLREPSGSSREFDRREALRTVTLVGVLLLKLGRTKENYMNDSAFKLGQLLAAADAVHAGYCADVRGGEVPPSLLGNQVFTMAQTAPATALAVLCRRWKPYAGWANKAARERNTESLVNSKDKREERRGWDIRIALRQAREMAPLAEALRSGLDSCVPDDRFRAELLLGYVAGIPKSGSERREAQVDEDTAAENTREGA